MSRHNSRVNESLGWLKFDNRTFMDFANPKSKPEYRYADIVQRWLIGESLNAKELNIIASILLVHPEYAMYSQDPEKVICLFYKVFNGVELQETKPGQKGLYLYSLFYFQLLGGNYKDAYSTYQEISVLFKNTNSGKDNIYPEMVKKINEIGKDDNNGFKLEELPWRIQYAYCLIVNKILDLNQWEKFQMEHGLTCIPCFSVPVEQYQEIRLRSDALYFLTYKHYDKALDIYRKLRLISFEVPATLIHMARVELAIGELDEAALHINKAWQLRHQAKAYVVPRIIFLFVFFCMIKSELYGTWLGCLKEALNRTGSRVEWDLEFIIDEYTDRLGSENSSFLRILLKELSGLQRTDIQEVIPGWESVRCLPEEAWNAVATPL